MDRALRERRAVFSYFALILALQMKSAPPDSLAALTEELRAFVRARDWQEFHSPKNLVMALMVEVAELMEHFQWLTNEQADELDGGQIAEVTDEVADVQIYLLELADRLGIDVATAVRAKMAKNALKYPAP